VQAEDDGPSQVITNIRCTFRIVDRELSNKLARLRQFVDVHVATTAVNVLLLFFSLTLSSTEASYIFLWRKNSNRAQATLLLNFLNHTQTNTYPVGIFWTTNQLFAEDDTCTTHNIPTSMPSAVFETAVPAFKRIQTCALYRTAPGIGEASTGFLIISMNNCDSETI